MIWARRVTYSYVRRLYGASGLDARSFARVFGISLQLAYGIAAPSARSRRLNPSRADQILGVRDSFIRQLASQKRSWEWGRNNLSGVLRSLFPHLRQTYRQLVNVFARSAEFLEAETDANIDRWQDWLCDQARLETAGSIPGKLFTTFLPVANEVCPFVKENLERFRSGYRVSRLAIEALAWRFGTSSVIVGYCGKSEKYGPQPVSPHAMQRLVLGPMAVQRAVSTAKRRPAKPLGAKPKYTLQKVRDFERRYKELESWGKVSIALGGRGTKSRG